MNNQNDLQSNEYVQNSKNIWTIIFSVIIAVLIVGGGAYAWQGTLQKNVLQEKINDLNNKNAEYNLAQKSLQEQLKVLQNQIAQIPQLKNLTDNKEEEVIKEVKSEEEIVAPNNSLKIYKDNNLGFEIKYPATWTNSLNIKYSENSTSFQLPAYSNVEKPELGTLNMSVLTIARKPISQFDSAYQKSVDGQGPLPGHEITRDSKYVYYKQLMYEAIFFVLKPGPLEQVSSVVATFKLTD